MGFPLDLSMGGGIYRTSPWLCCAYGSFFVLCVSTKRKNKDIGLIRVTATMARWSSCVL